MKIRSFCSLFALVICLLVFQGCTIQNPAGVAELLTELSDGTHSDIDAPTEDYEIPSDIIKEESTANIESSTSETPETSDSPAAALVSTSETDDSGAETSNSGEKQPTQPGPAKPTVTAAPAAAATLPENTSDESPKYENQDLGFSMEFPNSWSDSYTVEANPGDESSASVAVYTDWGGRLCSVSRYTLKEWTGSAEGGMIPVEYLILGQNDSYVYTLLFASDVQYDPEDEEQVNTYYEMRNDLYNVKFEIIG